MLRTSCFAALVSLFTVGAVAQAQRRVFVATQPASAGRFQAPTTAAVGRMLSGTTLHAAAASPTISAHDTATTVRRTCPMPIAAPDTTRLDRMPLTAGDTTRRDAMPVGQPQCVNPLRR